MFKRLYIFTFLFILIGCSDKTINELPLTDINEVTNEVIEVIEYPENQATDTVTYYAIDGLRITADLYLIDETSPIFILFHRSGWSRGEYINSAIEFNNLGYNVMAVDLRSGMTSNGILNETAIQATKSGYATNLEDAVLDVEASIDYIRLNYNMDIYLLGSASSASLVLVTSESYIQSVSAIFSFSAGEYFEFENQSVAKKVELLKVPVFMTSASYEIDEWQNIFDAVGSEMKLAFYPEGFGQHGSESLWTSTKDNREFWAAMEYFLELIKEDAN